MKKFPGVLCLFLAAFAALLSTTQPAFTQTTTINDTDSSIVYSRGNDLTGGPITNWNYFSGVPQDYNQDEHSGNFYRSGPSSFQGASLAVTFNGMGITWIGKKGPNYGIASYSVDGGSPQNFDAYNGSGLDQHQNVTISGLPNGYHVLNISLLAQSNGSDYWQAIDAFQINGTPVPLSSGTVAGYNSPQLVFAPSQPGQGVWTCGDNNPTDLSGGHCWSNTANSSVSWTFTGSLIEVFGRPDKENGYFYVSIDDIPVAHIDGHFGNADDDALNAVLLYAQQVQFGTHTIKITVSGDHDDQSNDNYVQIDQFVAFGSGGGFPSGIYTITSGSNAVDGGFGYYSDYPAVQLYQTFSGNAYQQWQWNGSTFQNVGFSGHYMADNNDGTVTENGGDTWTVTQVTGGYTVRDNRTGHYLTNNNGVLAMTGTATTWTVTSVR